MFTSLLNNCLGNIFTKIYDSLYENYKGLTQNPRWLLMRKVARFKLGRIIMLFFLKRSSQSYLALLNKSNTCFEEIDLDTVVSNLKTEGLYLGINLPQEIVQEIIDFANQQFVMEIENRISVFIIPKKSK